MCEHWLEKRFVFCFQFSSNTHQRGGAVVPNPQKLLCVFGYGDMSIGKHKPAVPCSVLPLFTSFSLPQWSDSIARSAAALIWATVKSREVTPVAPIAQAAITTSNLR